MSCSLSVATSAFMVSSLRSPLRYAFIAVTRYCGFNPDKLGVPATARASFYVYNDETDVDALVESLGRAEKFFAF